MGYLANCGAFVGSHLVINEAARLAPEDPPPTLILSEYTQDLGVLDCPGEGSKTIVKPGGKLVLGRFAGRDNRACQESRL